MNTNGWNEYQVYVLDKLKTLDSLTETQVEILKKISALEVKASIWGCIGGGVTTVAIILVAILRGLI